MDDRVVNIPGGLTARATEDGHVAIVAHVGILVLSFDCTKENALKFAGRIIEAADELDQQNGREVMQ